MNKTHYNEEMSMTSIYNVLNTCQENTEAYERSTEDAHHLTQNLERNENTESSQAIDIKTQNKTEMIDIENPIPEESIIIEESIEVNSYDEKTKESDKAGINQIDEYGKYKLSNKQLKKEELKKRYDMIVLKYGEVEEVACSLCKEDETFLNDEIVLCDLCDVAFHQQCYGSELLNLDESDDSEWFCHRCSYLFENDLPAVSTRCEFCPEMKGAIKRIQEKSSKKWGHISCVESIIEVEYTDETLKENVKIEAYLEQNHYDRNKITCYLCKIKYGDCLQCDDTKCVKAYHVTCAQKHGLLLGWKDMFQLKREGDPKYFYPVYCKEHMKAKNKELYKKGEQISKENLEQGENCSYLLETTQLAESSLGSQQNHKLEKQVISTKSRGNSQQVSKEENPTLKRKRGRPPKKHAPNPVVANHEQKDLQISPKTNEELAIQTIKKNQDNKDKQDSNLKKREALPIKIKAMKSAPNFKEAESKIPSTDKTEDLDLQKNLYKFHSELAKLMSFKSWADEKGMKRTIQEYSRSKGLYDREAEELNVAKDPELKAILKISKIPRKKIFSVFKNFMSVKSSDNKKLLEANQDLNKNTLEKQPEKKVKSDNKDKTQRKPEEKIKVTEKSIIKEIKMDVAGAHKIDSDGDKDLENKRENVNGKTEMNLEALNVQKIIVPEFLPTFDKTISERLPVGEKAGSSALKLKKNASLPGDKKLDRNKPADTGDFMKGFMNNQKSNKLTTDSTINMNSSSFLENIFGSTKTVEPEKLKKEKKIEKYGGLSSIINGSDQIPFRTNMQWFMKSDESLQIESIFSPEVQEFLWPKGSEMLF